ncbi:hypothetical protein CNEONATNEC26_02328 [Clostridium neonatale]|nr:hypothetical protein CNEONATNEC26_02328 [Clostridium neonatale]
MSSGSKIKSSKKPIIGIKSGIKSIGDKAYPTVIKAKTFAIIGVSFFFNAMYTAGMSNFNFFALLFRSTILLS